MPLTTGAHHIGLTVSKLEDSARFFTSLLGRNDVRRNAGYPAIFVSDGRILVTQWATKEELATPFDKNQNVGLRHVAFQVESEEALNAIQARLADAGIHIEFAPEPLGQGAAKHMMCSEPSDVWVEFIWPGK